MSAMGKGAKKTPARVVELINVKASELGQNGAARAIGLPLYSIQKYMAGTAEPTSASLQKLAHFFGVSVSWLRGETEEGLIPSCESDDATPEQIAARSLLIQEASSVASSQDPDTWALCADVVGTIKGRPDSRGSFKKLVEKYSVAKN